MIIPSKHSGYQAGIRLYPGGGIGSIGGFAQPLTGADYNRRLQAGETSQNIRNSTKGLFGTGMSDANWGAMVQNAGMNSPTGRPMAGSDQFFQPVYNSQYQNYANPNTQANVSMYGTQPQQQGGFGGFGGLGGFGSMQATTGLQNQGPAQRQTYENYLKDIGDMHVLPQTREQFNAEQNQLGQQRQQGMNMLGRGNMNEIMAGLGGRQQGGFGGQPNNMMLSDMQYRGPTQSQPSQSGSFSGFGNLGSLLSGMLQKGGFGQQMQSPFSFQQPTPQQPSYQQPAPQQPVYQQPSYQQPSYQQPAPQQPVYQQPTPQQPVYQQPSYQEPTPQQPVYQQPSYQEPTPQQPVYQQPSYQEPAPQQPSYQQPSYQEPAPQQPSYQQPSYQQPSYQQPSYQQPSYEQPSYEQQLEVQPVLQRTSSGPTSAIVGRSAGLRGTPNVMQYRAKGGIASLMDNVE